jgi:hypothetical protein
VRGMMRFLEVISSKIESILFLPRGQLPLP